MDFGDIITLVLFLAFIVYSFLKRKKTQKPGKSKQRGFSVLGKLKEVLKKAAREMEAQAEQARKKEAPGQSKHPWERNESLFDQAREKSVNQTFWDEIDDGEDMDFYPDDAEAQVLEPIESVNEKPLFVSTKEEFYGKAPRIPATRDSKSIALKPFGHDAMQISCLRSGPRQLPARARGLRTAVIWSEILGKPVALRD